MAYVFIPPAMRSLVNNEQRVEANGKNVAELLGDIERRYPGVRNRLCDQGRLRPGTSVVVNGSVASLGLRQTVGPNDEVHFLPSIGGG